MEITEKLAETVKAELDWLQRVIDNRLKLYFNNESTVQSIAEIRPPDLSSDDSVYAEIVKTHQLDDSNRLVLILSLVPYVQPNLLDVFLIKNQNLNIDFSEFGGIKDTKVPGFMPTMETAAFIISGSDLHARYAFLNMLYRKNSLVYNGILLCDTSSKLGLHEPLVVAPQYLSLFVQGQKSMPKYGSTFPAKQISTRMVWSDLIIEETVKQQLSEISNWTQYQDRILNNWGLNKHLKSGYLTMFHGPPGTGKTLAAKLIGKTTDCLVYQINLSMVISKYIGETEKNLDQLFNQAEKDNWILFFDEADALFGKRTEVNDAHDRYANQEVSYLLQRLEDFGGLAIVATHNKANLDDAFSRRFDQVIHFPKPNVKERTLLWKDLFTNKNWEINHIDFDQIAANYELTGGEITQVLRYCALKMASRNDTTLTEEDLLKGICRVLNKQHK